MTDKNRKISVMGIVNLTDDSFYPASRNLGTDGKTDTVRAMRRIEKMLEEGADMIDIGAWSSRPGAAPITPEEEWARLHPLLDGIAASFPGISISVDTMDSTVAEKCFDTIGRFTVNDISAGEDDPQMLGTAGRLGLPYIAMHKRGTPATMQTMCTYNDVTEDLLDYFRRFGTRAGDAGIADWIIDPGFGFAKNTEQNFRLLSDLDRFSVFGRRILVGVSRKSMIYKTFGITPEEALPQTQVLHFAALQKGADILRVHDVGEAVRTVKVYRMTSE